MTIDPTRPARPTWSRLAVWVGLAVVAALSARFPTPLHLDVAVLAVAFAAGAVPATIAAAAGGVSSLAIGFLVSVAAAAATALVLRRAFRAGELPSRSALRVAALVVVAAVAALIDLPLASRGASTLPAQWSVLTLGYLAGMLLAASVWWMPSGRRGITAPFLVSLTALITVASMLFTLSFWDRQDESLLHVTVNGAAVAFGSTLANEMNVVTTKAATSSAEAFTKSTFPRLLQTVVFGHDTIPAAQLVDLTATGDVEVLDTVTSLGDPLGAELNAWMQASPGSLEKVAASDVITYLGLASLTHPEGGESPFLVYATPIVNPEATHASGPASRFLVVALSVDEMMRSAVAPTLAGTGETTITMAQVVDGAAREVWRSDGGPTDANGDPGAMPTDLRGGRALYDFDLGTDHFVFVAKPALDFGTPASLRRLVIALEGTLGLFLIGLVLVNSDHAARRERERVRREALLAAALEGAPGWTSIVDLDGKVVMANGDPHGVGAGASLASAPLWVDDADAQAAVRALVTKARGGTVGTMQHLWADPADASHAIRIFDIEARPLPHQSLVYLQCVDVTENRDRAMRTAQSERMEAIGVLAGGLAHDFNNLLFITLGYLQMLERLPLIDDDAQSRLYVGRAIEAVERGAVVAKSLLAFARSQPLTSVPINLDQFLGELRPLIEQALGNAHTLEITADGSELDVIVDPGRLSSSILNAVFNARDAMESRGALFIHVERGVASPPGGEPMPVISISVRDTGRGMSPEVLARAFEPFFTTKQIGSGTGLGLSTVYSFAQQSGGWASIDSIDGAGTTVIIHLPPALEQPVDDETPRRLPRPATRALVVDDETALAELVGGWLTDLGMQTRVATSPEQALRVAEEFRPELLVSDANLGTDVDGLELARMLVEREPSLLVVFMTGFSERIRALQAAGVATLAKPFSRDDLLHSLVTHLGDRLLTDGPTGPLS